MGFGPQVSLKAKLIMSAQHCAAASWEQNTTEVKQHTLLSETTAKSFRTQILLINIKEKEIRE